MTTYMAFSFFFFLDELWMIFFFKKAVQKSNIFLYSCQIENHGHYHKNTSKICNFLTYSENMDIYSAYVNTSQLPLCAFSNHNRFSTDT